MMKKLVCFVLVTCMLLGVLAGCGAQKQEPAPATESGSAPAAAEKETPQAPAEKVELDLWYYWDGSLQDILNSYVEKFNAQSETAVVTATYVPIGEYNQKVLTSAAGGKVPDILVCGVDAIATMAEAGILGVMTQSVKDGGFEERVLPEVLRAHEYKGEYYGLPIYSNCLALFYNKAMVPEAPTTWDELMEVAAKVTTKDCYALAVSAVESEEGIFQFLPWLWSAGADLDTLDSEEGVAAVQLYKDLIDKGYMSKEVLSWSQQDAMLQFSSGRAAMMVNGPWNVPPILENAPDMDFGVTVLPAREKGGSASILGGESFGVAVGANVEAASEFFNWIYSEEIYTDFLREMGQMPAEESLLMDAYYQNDPVQKAFADNLMVAKPRAYGASYGEMSSALQVALAASLSGMKTPEDAMKEAAAVVNPLLGQ